MNRELGENNLGQRCFLQCWSLFCCRWLGGGANHSRPAAAAAGANSQANTDSRSRKMKTSMSSGSARTW